MDRINGLIELPRLSLFSRPESDVSTKSQGLYMTLKDLLSSSLVIKSRKVKVTEYTRWDVEVLSAQRRIEIRS